MGAVAGDASDHVQKHCRRVFVGGNGSAKSDVSQVLQGIGESIVIGISSLPEPVSLGELLRSKGGKTEQIVRAVFNHVDAQIVPRIDAKVRPVCVTEVETIKLRETVE